MQNYLPVSVPQTIRCFHQTCYNTVISKDLGAAKMFAQIVNLLYHRVAGLRLLSKSSHWNLNITEPLK